jgi:hypothetical protein
VLPFNYFMEQASHGMGELLDMGQQLPSLTERQIAAWAGSGLPI